MVKSNFFPIGDFFKPCPSDAKAGFKNHQVGEKWVYDDYSYLCEGLYVEGWLYIFLGS
ncbi:hypothetical protein [uncultured Gammaproteobacteria bacterium]|nr:ADP compounds hydrolase NudE [uncultured Gammaproteobacteria bacterium]CAC9603966.1 hypothetical protein [uncultured Gammaproteobacteria bacterium]CAC9646751.1 hypothetical protein [uncultured Gammaproteobacteria bacterium]CAC9657821.1 hypothetical protein [uncultured Gammaproteobacteria bacterium]CAC9971670.1 hypothetical protein [uncultured Gammaproteobacteria bacterium]